MIDNDIQDSNNDYTYQVLVLRKMVNELPSNLSSILLKQIDEVEKATINHQKNIYQSILPHLEDAMVDIKYLEFDRHATEQEKQKALKLKFSPEEILALKWFAQEISERPPGAVLIIKNLLKRYKKLGL